MVLKTTSNKTGILKSGAAPLYRSLVTSLINATMSVMGVNYEDSCTHAAGRHTVKRIAEEAKSMTYVVQTKKYYLACLCLMTFSLFLVFGNFSFSLFSFLLLHCLFVSFLQVHHLWVYRKTMYNVM